MKNQGNKKIKKKTIGILVVIALCVAVIAMNSYAFWSITSTQSGTNVVSSGCFDLDFIEGDAITLSNQFPIIDADSENLSPYTFTITNTCNLYASYQVNLEVLPVQGAETKLADQYVKVSLNNSDKRILTEHEEVSTTISGAITSYKLTIGELYENESVTYDLREWLEENTPLSQVNTSFRSKIAVIAVPTEEPCANCGILKVSESDPTETLTFLNSPLPIVRNNIESIVFVDHKTVPVTALGSWDVSAAQDNSVMAWYEDTNSNSIYEITIGSLGGVKGNANSSSLFENVRNLDSIDLTHFYTREVTNMQNIFYYTGYNSTVFTLDVSNFDTSNATNMQGLFAQTGYSSPVFTLDVSNFDTSNVFTMFGMFLNVGRSNPTFTLDLGDKFDTSNVISMFNMFTNTGFSNPTFTLNLGDKFDTKKVTNMSYMFTNTGFSNPNFTLNLRNFDFSSVVTWGSSMLNTGKATHKIYASSSNVSFMSGKGFTGTIINCTTSPASCS